MWKLQYRSKHGSPLLKLHGAAAWTSTIHAWHSLSAQTFCVATQEGMKLPLSAWLVHEHLLLGSCLFFSHLKKSLKTDTFENKNIWNSYLEKKLLVIWLGEEQLQEVYPWPGTQLGWSRSLHWVRNRVGFHSLPGGAGSDVSQEHSREWEAQSSCGMEDLRREALQLDIREDERKYSTNP